MTSKKRLGIIYSIVFLLMLAVNYLTATNVGSIADENPAIIQPAGYVFSIWGVIYLLLFIWIIRLFFIKNDTEQLLERLHYWPVVNFVLNGAWIFTFTERLYFLSTVVIVALLVTLFVIYKKLSHPSVFWFDRLPFSIYFGWGTVATIVNIVTWVKKNGIEEVLGFNEYQWTLALLIIATGIAVFVSLLHTDWLYPLVFAWAYVGIIIRNDYDLFWLTVICGVSILVHAGVSMYTGYKRIKN
ncbi:TspO/MBR family protein [Alkalibacterium kapii]|uniref:Tryptophan-rich sensory protein n=1 Tax=Alkalibacterium kapii TaxID=426704 RepID=A0A511AU18_9LACT|nr:TspO/MBR family protein [Alkalibacterium kapii]GEK91688.1 tryptophan-rich sensory protein [Alkalibacterium kapii]